MNELYNETIVRNGKTYHYDPDMDCYYCRSTTVSSFDRYSWIVAIVVMSLVCLYVEFVQ